MPRRASLLWALKLWGISGEGERVVVCPAAVWVGNEGRVIWKLPWSRGRFQIPGVVQTLPFTVKET